MMEGIGSTRYNQQQPPLTINNGSGGGGVQCCFECGCRSRNHNDSEKIMSGCYPPGYAFEPSDVEIIKYYLKKKIMNEELLHNDQIMKKMILEVDLYKFNPEQLAEIYKLHNGKKETCFFFTPRERRTLNESRPNRSAGNGFWRATTAAKAIKEFRGGPIIGFKAALVWYKGKTVIKENKTDWIMHEYTYNGSRRKRSNANDMKLDEWVLCNIHKNGRSNTTNGASTAQENTDGAPTAEENTNGAPTVEENTVLVTGKSLLDPGTYINNDTVMHIPMGMNHAPYSLQVGAFPDLEFAPVNSIEDEDEKIERFLLMEDLGLI